MIIWAPVLLYCAIFPLAAALVFNYCSSAIYAGFFWPFWLFLIAAQALLGGLLLMIVVACDRITLIYRHNLADYLMTGLRRREIAVGLAAPYVKSAIRTVLPTAIAGLAIGFLLVIQITDLQFTLLDLFHPKNIPAHQLEEDLRQALEHLTPAAVFFMLLVLVVSVEACLWYPMGMAVSMALWHLPKWQRLAGVMLVPLTSPAFLVCCIKLNYGLLLLALLRPVVVAAIWHRSFRHN